MASNSLSIRNANYSEFDEIGQLMCNVYAALPDFPSPDEQPKYYQTLANVGAFTEKPVTEILVAVNENQEILGAVVYFGDMANYGSGGIATLETNTAGFRLLSVSSAAQGRGIGKALTLACIEKGKESGRKQLIIHSTKAMQVAWDMYERIGFKRSDDLDFLQQGFPVYGFRYIF